MIFQNYLPFLTIFI